VALCEQQRNVIATALPVSVGLVSGASAPDQWKDPRFWQTVISNYRIIVSTPQVLLDALRHGYLHLGHDIGLLIFDEAHHATDKHPYHLIMEEFYVNLPRRGSTVVRSDPEPIPVRPQVLGLTASPIFGGHVQAAFL
jgi:endoribonuclease Dicer